MAEKATNISLIYNGKCGDLEVKDCQNNRGSRGPRGCPGEQGIKGDRGLEGPRGVEGIQGLRGNQGERGQVGYTGPTGNYGGPILNDIVPYDNNVISIGKEGYSLNRLFCNRLYVGSSVITYSTSENTISLPYGTLLGDIPIGTIHILGSITPTYFGNIFSYANTFGSITNPSIGDGYIVGNNLYVYDGSLFTDLGEIRGHTGPIGYTGYTGYTGPIGYTGYTGAIGYTGYTGPTGPSQWGQNINDIYYVPGNIGVGTSAPQHTLDVSGSLNVSQTSFLNNYVHRSHNNASHSNNTYTVNYLDGTSYVLNGHNDVSNITLKINNMPSITDYSNNYFMSALIKGGTTTSSNSYINEVLVSESDISHAHIIPKHSNNSYSVNLSNINSSDFILQQLMYLYLDNSGHILSEINTYQ